MSPGRGAAGHRRRRKSRICHLKTVVVGYTLGRVAPGHVPWDADAGSARAARPRRPRRGTNPPTTAPRYEPVRTGPRWRAHLPPGGASGAAPVPRRRAGRHRSTRLHERDITLHPIMDTIDTPGEELAARAPV